MFSGAFRFLELPPELRNRVYSHLISSPEVDVWRYRVPPIARTSKQLRRETLSIFCSTARFTMSVGTRFNSAQDCAKAVRGWANIVGTPMLKHLRSVTLSLEVENTTARPARIARSPIAIRRFEFTYEPKTGLAVSCAKVCSDGTKDDVRRHVVEMADNCAVVGIEDGRAIVMALLSSTSMWASWR